MTEYEKPRRFRDRTKKKKYRDEDLHHPVHKPYERDNAEWRRNIVIDGRGDYDDDDKDCGTD